MDKSDIFNKYVNNVSHSKYAMSMVHINEILNAIFNLGYKSILDCGSGLTSAILRNENLEVTSVDSSKEWLDKTNGFLQNNNINNDRLYHMNVDDILNNYNTYDFIIVDYAVACEERMQIISHLFDNNLKDGGCIYFDDTHKTKFRKAVFALAKSRNIVLHRSNLKDEYDRFGHFGYKKKHKVLFWSPIDPIIYPYIKLNKSLQSISHAHDLLLVCSNYAEDLISNFGSKTKTLKCENNLVKKGKYAYEFAKENRYDSLIKIDMDAAITNVSLLLDKCLKYQNEKAIIGNKMRSKKFTYVRGGCNISTKALIQDFTMLTDICDGNRLDYATNKSVIACGGKQIFDNCFIMANSIDKNQPAVHPNKENKWDDFVNIMSRYS